MMEKQLPGPSSAGARKAVVPLIINRVSRLMGERRENVRSLASATGIAYGTAYKLYKGTTKRIEFDTLDRLCQHFGVSAGDILEYIADAPRERSS
jgi:putative transcriptional regulator